jgi:hypothetical protein
MLVDINTLAIIVVSGPSLEHRGKIATINNYHPVDKE